MERNVPKLRFKEFNDEWKISKVGEITSKVGSGKTPKGGNSVYVSDGIMFIRSQNVLNGKLSLDDVVYISEEENDRMKSTQIKANDVLINITGASIGRCCKVPADFKNGNLNQHVCIIRPNKDNSEFIMNYMISDKIQKQIFNFQAGGNREGLNFEQIKGMTIGMPSIQEQERIANFLTKVDRIIEKQDEKVKNLEKYKKGMMQKIFSQEIRFKDENGEAYPEWEEKKIGNITKITDGVHFTPEYVDNGIPFWSVETIVSGANPKFITREAHNLAIKRCHPEKNDILITRIGSLAKSKVISSNEELSIYVSVALIKASDKFNSKFMKQYFDSEIYLKEFLSKSLLTATPKKINMEDLKTTKVILPCLEEQRKIAKVLSNIDLILEKQNMKLEELREWKKGLLQNMFV